MKTVTLTPIEDPNDEPHEEFDVGVSFFGRDFVLTALWHTDESTDEEVRINAAADWFAETYGFNPSEHAVNVTVSEIPRGKVSDDEWVKRLRDTWPNADIC